MPQRSRPSRGSALSAFRYPGEKLRQHWERLHHGDREPWPDETLVARFSKQHAAFASWAHSYGGAAAVAQGLQDAWREFHAGDFGRAITHGDELSALGASVANKAAGIDSLYSNKNGASILKMLDTAVQRGEAAVKLLPDYANAHYMLALVLGRYSQRISILKALAEGLAGRVRSHLERTLALEPRHAEAHLALGLYHAEIVSKLGGLAAGLTYGASRNAAVEHFRHAVRLAPASPIIHMEYGNGLMLLDGERARGEASTLYEQAGACEPVDAMESLDAKRAQQGVT
jgi:tetratricopeptide (TPR) repeat protein